MQIRLKPRTVGELVGLTLQLSIAHFPALFAIFLVVNAPVLWIQLELQAALNARQPVMILTGVALIVPMLLSALSSAAATTIVAGSFTGQRTTLGAALTIALRRLLPLIGFTLAYGVLVGLGTLLLIVPGILVLVRLYVGTCALVLDGTGVNASFARADALSAGRRWPILGFVLLITLVSVVPAMALGALMGAVNPASDFDESSTGGVVVSWLVNTLLGVIGVVAPVVMYFDLRVRREAFDVEQLAELVDRIGREGAERG